MMRTDPTRETILKLTLSTMTTMTTVLHLDLEHDLSSSPFFPLNNLFVFRVFFGLYGVGCTIVHWSL